MNKRVRIIGISGAFILFLANQGQAYTTSYLVQEGFGESTSNYNNMFAEFSWTVYIDPNETNWIAWNNSDSVSTDSVAGVDYVGSLDTIGVDDYFKVEITDESGNSSGLMQMDYNNSSAYSTGQQAVFYGTSTDAPDVYRYNGFKQDEAGLFNDYFNTYGAGTYTFSFELWNLVPSHQGTKDFYMLVDTTSEPVPEPTTMILFGTGLAGLLGYKRKKM